MSKVKSAIIEYTAARSVYQSYWSVNIYPSMDGIAMPFVRTLDQVITYLRKLAPTYDIHYESIKLVTHGVTSNGEHDPNPILINEINNIWDDDELTVLRLRVA
jgi:hypothetical protein